MNATTISELTRENGWAPLREHTWAHVPSGSTPTRRTPTSRSSASTTKRRRATRSCTSSSQAAPRSRWKERSATRRWAPRCSSRPGRSARRDALEDGTTIVVVGGRPGAVFRPRAWETNAIIFPMFGEGRIEEAREMLRGVVGRVRGRRVDRVQPRLLRGSARRRRAGVRAPRPLARGPAGSRGARPWRRRPGRIARRSAVRRAGRSALRLRRPAEPDARRVWRAPDWGASVASSACSMRATWRSFFVSRRRLSMGFEGSPVER